MEANNSAEHDGVAAALAAAATAAAAAAAAASSSASWEHVQTDYDRDLQRLEQEMIARHVAQSAHLNQSLSGWEEGGNGGAHDHHHSQHHHAYHGDYGHEATEYQRRPSALERGFDVDLSDRITMGLMDSSELRPLPAHLNLQRLRLESQQRAEAGQQALGPGSGPGSSSSGVPQPGQTTLDKRGFDVNLTDRVFMGVMMDSTELRPLPPGVRTVSSTAAASLASGAAGGEAAGGGGGGRPGAAASLSRNGSDGGTAADGSNSNGQKGLLERANSNSSSSGRGLWGMGGKSQRTAAAAAESSVNSSSSSGGGTTGKSPHQRAKSRLGLSPSFRGGSGGGGGGGANGATAEAAETLPTPPEQPGNDGADAESELDFQHIANDPLANSIMAGPLEPLSGLKSIMLDPSQLRLRRMFLEGQGGRVFHGEYKGISVLVHLMRRGDDSSAERDAEGGASVVRDVQRIHTIPPHTNLSGVCAAACVRVRRQQQQQDAPAHGGDPPTATWCTVTEFTGLGLTLREALDRMNGSTGATTSGNSSGGSGSGSASSSVAASRKGGSVPFATAASLALAVAQGMAHLHATFGPHPSGLSSHTIAPSPPGNSAADTPSRGTGGGGGGSSGCIIGGNAKVMGLLTEASIRDAPGHTPETGGYRWMAPECIHSKGPRHPKSDVFSFGIVLWELVTGEIPYGATTTPMQVAFSVVQKKQRPEIPDKCPPSFARLMEDCWRNDPEARPSFSEIVPRLESAKISVAISGSGRRRGILGCFSSPPTQD